MSRWRRSLALWLYSQFVRLLTPLVLLRYLWRSRREPLYGRWLRERFGLGRPVAPGAVWIHAVSLGETRAAAPLIQALRMQQPDLHLLLTHGTATGRETGAMLLAEGDEQRWLPLDLPGATRRFMRRHRPAIGVLMETEVWPNLQRAAAEQGVPMLLVNARLSARSLAKSLRLDALLRPAAQSMTLTLAQTSEDAQRLMSAGARPVQVCGNLKFDLLPDPGLLERGRRWRAALPLTQGGKRPRRVVLAAVWREGEDELLLTIWRQWLLSLPQRDTTAWPLLLIVPRHPQRFDEVAQMVVKHGLELSRRSEWPDDAPPASAMHADVWLGDSLREMPAYYALADVALLGGSFAPLGGQNLIEAAACGCPLVMGPHTFNFAHAADLAAAQGAAQRAADLGEAVAMAGQLAGDDLALAERAAACLRFSRAHQGAATRCAAAVLAHWHPPAGA
jgi:3-deoxy-D-manno-octulosonic-acid transferase